MSDRVPVSLFKTSRALCPGCGAPLALDVTQTLAECGFCKTRSLVERRLRSVEAKLAGGLEPALAPTAAAQPWIPAHRLGGQAFRDATCLGCGHPFESDESQNILRCAHCQSEAKVERRLVLSEGLQWLGEPAEAEKKRNSNPSDLAADVRQDEIAQQILNAQGLDLRQRFELARSFQGWNHLNPERETVLVELIARMPGCEHVVDELLAAGIQSMLNRFDEWRPAHRLAVLRIVARGIFDVGGSTALIYSLGLVSGGGVALKLLLDVAEFAVDAGTEAGLRYAAHALNAYCMTVGRNYENRSLFDDIVLHRLIYMKTPLVAYVLDNAVYPLYLHRYGWREMGRFIEDCAFERPELVPVLKRRCPAHATDDAAEYRAILEFVDELETPAAQSFVLRRFCYSDDEFNPHEGSATDLEFSLDALHRRLSEPAFEALATWLIRKMMNGLYRTRAEIIEAFVRKHGESLPWEIRHTYERLFPNSKFLKPTGVRYNWGGEPPLEPATLDETLEAWRLRWKDAMGSAHEEQAARRGGVSRFRDALERIKEQEGANRS